MHETLCADIKGYIDSSESGWCFHTKEYICPLRFKTISGEYIIVENIKRLDVSEAYKNSKIVNCGWKLPNKSIGGSLEMEIENIWTPVFIFKQPSTKKPTICFATMCKNEEHCIRETLESVYKYIDYWVVHDTGSSDNTCNIVRDFFQEKEIPGELFIDSWQGFDINKTKLFEKCYGRTDYILHLDADDLLCGNFEFLPEDTGYLKYSITTKRNNSRYKCSVIFNNSVHWKFVGVAHTIIKNTDNPNNLLAVKDLSDRDFFYESRDTGKRSEDPEKYLKDALRLKEQFTNTLVEDPEGINTRSLFYMAQSYYDQHMYLEAAQNYSLYTKMKNTWIEEEFEANLRLFICFRNLNYPIEKILAQAKKTIDIFPDRAEPYYILGKHLNHIKQFELAYDYLKAARAKKLTDVLEKYSLFVINRYYGKYVNDELSVSCYWTNRPSEGIDLINEIIDDPDFECSKERITKNLYLCKQNLGSNKNL